MRDNGFLSIPDRDIVKLFVALLYATLAVAVSAI